MMNSNAISATGLIARMRVAGQKSHAQNTHLREFVLDLPLRPRGRTRGRRMGLLGSGNAHRTPPEKTTALYSSGTLSCITGLLRYRSTLSSKPCWGPLQLTLHTFLLKRLHLQ